MSETKSSVFGEGFRSELKEALREVMHEERLATNSEAIRCNNEAGLVNAEEAARYLSISKAWLYKNANRLPFATKIGGALRFDKMGMRRWLEAQRR